MFKKQRMKKTMAVFLSMLVFVGNLCGNAAELQQTDAAAENAIQLMETELQETETAAETEAHQTEAMTESGTLSTEAVTESATETVSTETMPTESMLQTEITPAENGQAFISIQKESMFLEVSRADASPIPSDVSIRLRSLEEIAADDGGASEMVEEFRKILVDAAADALRAWVLAADITDFPAAGLSADQLNQACMDSLILISPAEYSMFYADGSTYEAQYLNLTIQEILQEQSEGCLSLFLTYDHALQAKIYDTVQCSWVGGSGDLNIRLSGLEVPNLFSFALFDTGIFENTIQSLISDTETDDTGESELKEEEEAESVRNEETEDITAVRFAYDSIQQGVPCIASGEYTTVRQGEGLYSSKYSFIRGSSKSKVEYWYDSSQVIKGYRESNGVEYLMPLTMDAKGNFGFRITNVAYNRDYGCNMDLMVTVSDYLNYSYDRNGDKVEDIYPYIGIDEDLIFYFIGGLPGIELTCSLVKTGTSEQIPGNYRFMWYDVDSGQRYGFALTDGTIDARYCLTDCEINCGTETAFNQQYHMLYARNDNTERTDAKRSVMFEVSNMSEFKMLIKQSGNVTASGTLLREQFLDASDGVFNQSAGSVLVWDGSAYGPTEMPDPLIKYVSNNGETWQKENTLDSPVSEYWYMLELFVPQESSEFYYSELTVKDQLPAGVDYVGSFSAVIAETGKKKKGFTISAEEDQVTIDASELVDSDSFYGWTYCLKFKVKMDPTELTPQYKNNMAVYAVTNQAELNGKHKADSSIASNTSNSVKTNASEYLMGRILLKKEDPQKEALEGAEFILTAAEDIRRYDGAVLIESGTDVASGVTGEDGTVIFDNCYPGVYHISEQKPPAGYTLNTEQMKVTVPQADTSGQIADSSITFVNEPTKVIIQKISASEDDAPAPLPGVKFHIWSENADSGQAKEYVTDEKGEILMTGLLPGTYLYQETETLPGYLLDNTVYSFTLDESGRCENEHARRLICENRFTHIRISKTDEATGALISGARLQLTDENGTVMDTWISEEKPHSVKCIPPGKYILTELEAPSGYQAGSAEELIVKESSEIQSFSIANCRYVELKLTKTIRAEDIVWVHGNPVFTFCVEGTDLSGAFHRYYRAVEFEELNTADKGNVSLSACFYVPAGEYRAYETNVIRYKLSSIDSVKNGTVSGVGVVFDLKNNESGAATFTNIKQNDDGLSETDYVKNVIIPQK